MEGSVTVNTPEPGHFYTQHMWAEQMDGAITHNSLTIVKFIGTVGILESVKALQREENDGWHGGAFHSHFSSPGRTFFIFKPLAALCVHW